MTEKFDPAAGKDRVRTPESERSRQNKPILSETKGERVYTIHPISQECWAYLKLLREHDKTKKIYPVDPYAEVYQFRDNLYAILTESLDGMGDPWMFLIIGPEKALLIDTSFGLGDLKGLVDELTGGKELIVVNTHGHFDHAYGDAQFERVYCHEYEVPLLELQDAHMWDYLFEEGTGRGIWADFDRNDLIPFKNFEIVGCPDGYTFDLGGGYEVEMIHTGGHTSGHCCFLDKSNRILFLGDTSGSVPGPRAGLPYGEYSTVPALRDNLRKLAKRADEFDSVFPSHFIVDQEPVVVQFLLDACEEICRDPEKNFDTKEETGNGTRYYRRVEGLGNFSYFMNSFQ